VIDKAGSSEECSSEHSCCSQNDESTDSALTKVTSNQMGAGRCCMLAGEVDTPAVLPESMGGRASLLSEGEPPIAPNTYLRPARICNQSSIPDRGGTYLQCCALLI
jgi:hypothetical protein